MTTLPKPTREERENRKKAKKQRAAALRRTALPARRSRIRVRRPLGTVRREAKATGDLTQEQWAAICDFYRDPQGWCRCAYCETALATQQDHVRPLSKGGKHTAGNVVVSCEPCNLRKGTSTRWQPVRRHPFMEAA